MTPEYSPLTKRDIAFLYAGAAAAFVGALVGTGAIL